MTKTSELREDGYYIAQGDESVFIPSDPLEEIPEKEKQALKELADKEIDLWVEFRNKL